VKPCSVFGISATTRSIIASAPATNGSWFRPTRGSSKTPHAKMLVRRNDVDRIHGDPPAQTSRGLPRSWPQKEAPSSPEASRGLTARSSARLLLSGPTSGVSGGTGISRLDGPAQSGCPNPARSIRDGQHISGFSTSRARKKTPRNTDLIQFAPQHFPDQGPLVPHSGAHNSNGEGECRENQRRL
jgi:hypothetical protein